MTNLTPERLAEIERNLQRFNDAYGMVLSVRIDRAEELKGEYLGLAIGFGLHAVPELVAHVRERDAEVAALRGLLVRVLRHFGQQSSDPDGVHLPGDLFWDIKEALAPSPEDAP